MLSKNKFSKCKLLFMVLAVGLVFLLPVFPAFADTTDVAGAVTTAFGTYMKPQIKSITNGVIMPVLDGCLVIAAIVSAVMAWFNYKKQGQFRWEVLAVIGGCLVLSLSAPLWMWKAIGWG